MSTNVAAAGAWRRVHPAIPAAIGLAWAIAFAADLSGRAGGVNHDHLIQGGLPIWTVLLVFLLAWQAMIAAMMLPSSLPLVALFARASGGQERPRVVMAAFLSGYALVWTTFGVLALTFDVGVHATVDAWPWLSAHDYLIGPGVLVLAGAFQFTDLKDSCLRSCRHPGSFIQRHYRRGTRGAIVLGLRHGLFCLGCCWALMLVAFSLGMANLWWMAALTALMVFEKTHTNGARAVPVAGIALLGAAAILLPYNAWVAGALG